MKRVAISIGFMILGALLVISATVPAAVLTPEITEWWSNLGKFGTVLVENPFLLVLFLAGIVFAALGVAVAITTLMRKEFDQEYDGGYMDEQQPAYAVEPEADGYDVEYADDYTEEYAEEEYPEEYREGYEQEQEEQFVEQYMEEDLYEEQPEDDFSATISRGTVARREFKPKQFEELDLDSLNNMEEGEEVEIGELGQFEEVELGDLEIESDDDSQHEDNQ